MILPSEVEAILEGRMPPEEEDVACDHYTLGGFHSRVPESDRRRFVAWFNARPARGIMQQVEFQLDLDLPLQAAS